MNKKGFTFTPSTESQDSDEQSIDTKMPLSVRRMKLISSICDNINTAGLPAFAVVDVLEHILREASSMARAEYENDLKAYEAFKKEQAHGESGGD